MTTDTDTENPDSGSSTEFGSGEATSGETASSARSVALSGTAEVLVTASTDAPLSRRTAATGDATGAIVSTATHMPRLESPPT